MRRIGASFYDRDYYIGATKSAYEDYSLCRGVMSTLGEMILEAYGPLRRVLDVGCAYGYLVGYLRERGIEAWGVDISGFAVAQAPSEALPYLCVGSLVALPFADNAFDLVLSSECLEHVYEDEARVALSEIARVSRGKACMLIGLNEDMEDRDKGHVNLRSRRWWEELIAAYAQLRTDAGPSGFLNQHDSSRYMKWANRFFCLNISDKVSHRAGKFGGSEEIPAEFFDEEYFDGKGTKSAYKGYTEEGLAGIFPPLAQLLRSTFRPVSALDCGCAKGYLVKSLRSVGVDAYGQDISSYAVESASIDIRPYMMVGSITKLQFASDRFDMVISTDTLEHLTLSQIDAALAEMKRVAKRYLFLTICLNLEPGCPDDFIGTDPNDKSHITIASRNFWHKRFTGVGLNHRPDLEDALSSADLCRDMKWNIFVYEKLKLRHRIADFLKHVRKRLTWQRLKGRVRWLLSVLIQAKGKP